MADNDQSSAADKTHDPTPQRLKRSRDQGEVPYSSEVTAASTYGAFFIAMIVFAGWCATRLLSELSIFFHRPEDISVLLLERGDDGFAGELMTRILFPLAPIFAVLMLAALASIFAQNAFAFAPTKLSPKLARLSIIDNAKQKFGMNGLSEFLKSAAKLSAVLGILLFAFKDRFFQLPELATRPAEAVGEVILREIIFFGGLITAAAMLIAAIDWPWRQFQHRNKLKMTHQELKEESKESEGDPALKSARRQRAEAIATNRMMQDVPDADVVIVNPTHYAVALKWERGVRAAPQCVAKGVDETAARIREAAATAGVPIKRDPPTARSIYAVVEIGQEVKREHYAAVAAAIHYAEKMRKRWRAKESKS